MAGTPNVGQPQGQCDTADAPGGSLWFHVACAQDVCPWACVLKGQTQPGAQGPPLSGVQVAQHHASLAWTPRALSLMSVPCPAPTDEPRASLHLPSSAGDVATWLSVAEGVRHPRAVSLPPSGPTLCP